MARRISRRELYKIFCVDLQRGKLFWKTPPKPRAGLVGLEAGTVRESRCGKKYWIVKLGGRAYGRAHLIFLAANGRYPRPMVDHRDGDSLNDRPSNLRDATRTQNAWNHKGRKRRIDLPMGVRLTKSGRFAARISFHGKQIHLGAFNTIDEASFVYAVKRQKLYGEFA